MPILSYKQLTKCFRENNLNDLLVSGRKSTIMVGLIELRQQQQIPLKCEICDEEFKSNSGLRKHFNIVHKLMKEHQCNICQKVFKLKMRKYFSQISTFLIRRKRNDAKSSTARVFKNVIVKFSAKQKM